MHAGQHDFQPDLRGLQPSEWMQHFRAHCEEKGFFEPLGRHHAAGFVDAGDTLIVSFETLPSIRQMTGGTPLSFEACQNSGWSALTLLARGDTWFRSRAVMDFFDNLIEDGFFEEFENVLFFGIGSAGFAACAYAAACPGARVLALRPQATLDPELAGWDGRFKRMRRLDFSGRYAYGPEGAARAAQTHILFDPRVREDAMHAALFQGPNVRRVKLPFLGPTPERDLRRMRLLTPLMYAAGTGALSRQTLARMMRSRREHPTYLRRLLAHLDSTGRTGLARKMCQSVLERREIPSLRRWLEERG